MTFDTDAVCHIIRQQHSWILNIFYLRYIPRRSRHSVLMYTCNGLSSMCPHSQTQTAVSKMAEQKCPGGNCV